MLYKCDSCGASMVYDPGKAGLVCPQCGNSIEKMPEGGRTSSDLCPVCGAPVERAEKMLVYQCPYCKSWMTLDDHLDDPDAPKKITPFSFGRKEARERILSAFDNIPFLPASFLAEPEEDRIEALYAPFWSYPVKAEAHYEYTAENQRSYTIGDTTHTDHDVYELFRDVEATFDGVPVDAMDSLDDGTIDAAISDVKDRAVDFDPVYLAGSSAFLPDRPSSDPEYLSRAKDWAAMTVRAKEPSLTRGYEEVKCTAAGGNAEADQAGATGSLLPVYRYIYKGFGTHKIYMDGTTGRMSGDAPCDVRRVVVHYAVEAACVLISAVSVIGILGVML